MSGGRAVRVVLGVCGSVAAPKSQQIASALVKAGYTVDVVLTESAKKYIGAYAFKGVINGTVYAELFLRGRKLKGGEEHIELAKSADLMVIAPATQSLISSLAYGDPKNPVALVAMNVAPQALMLCPAMSTAMWNHPSTQENVAKLRSWGAQFTGPVEGRLASGDNGIGRMAEPDDVVALVKAFVGRMRGDLRGSPFVISAGGCSEPIDSVRFLGNRSSGKQGHALAEAARDRGADVVLITSKPETAPLGLRKVVGVTGFNSFKEALSIEAVQGSVYIAAAAISDFKPAEVKKGKLERGEKGVAINLVPTEDLLGGLPDTVFKVAFAAEAGSDAENIERAKAKLQKKKARLIVLNDVNEKGAGFEASTNRVAIISADGKIVKFPEKAGAVADKYEVANAILDQIRSAISASEFMIASKKSS